MPTALRTRLTLDTAAVDAVLSAAEKYATEHGHRVVSAVVDAGGHLLALRRTDGAQVASSRVAVDKARTSAIFVRPSRDIEAQVSSGRIGALALRGAAALTGGIPLIVDGQVVGAIGACGRRTATSSTPPRRARASLARRRIGGPKPPDRFGPSTF